MLTNKKRVLKWMGNNYKRGIAVVVAGNPRATYNYIIEFHPNTISTGWGNGFEKLPAQKRTMQEILEKEAVRFGSPKAYVEVLFKNIEFNNENEAIEQLINNN